MSKTIYTVQRCAFKNSKFYGSVHGSNDGNWSICGIDFFADPANWYILTTEFDGEITCKKCLKAIKEAKEQKIPIQAYINRGKKRECARNG